MAEDYYKVLGLSRDASPADIQQAHRDLVRKYHPDVNKAPDAKDKFQQVQKAFEVLSDPAKREQYDRYGAAFEHMGSGGPGGGKGAPWQGTSRGPGGAGPSFEDFDFGQIFGEQANRGGGGFEDIFSQLNRAREAGSRQSRGRRKRGDDLRHEIEIPFATAVTGGESRISVERPGGPQETISVKIPPGVEEGQEIRLRGQGTPAERGEAGDLFLKLRIAAHPWFTRKGNHLYVRTPVTIGEAAAGARIDVPTPYGEVSVRVPPRSSSGTRLRVKGHGVRPRKGDPGDLFVELSVVLPAQLTEEEVEQLRQLDATHRQQPRSDLRW